MKHNKYSGIIVLGINHPLSESRLTPVLSFDPPSIEYVSICNSLSRQSTDMTAESAFNLDKCPECGGGVMKVPLTGLVACLAAIEFKPCRWFVRVARPEKKKKK